MSPPPLYFNSAPDILTFLGTPVLGTRRQHKVSAVPCKIKVCPSRHNQHAQPQLFSLSNLCFLIVLALARSCRSPPGLPARVPLWSPGPCAAAHRCPGTPSSSSRAGTALCGSRGGWLPGLQTRRAHRLPGHVLPLAAGPEPRPK